MTSLKRDDDDDDISLTEEFLRHLSSSGDVPPTPASRPPPPPSLTATIPPATTTTTTNSKAIDPMDVDTPPAVATDYYDANGDLCPRPSAPPLELLMEDGYYDETYAMSLSQPSQQSPHPPPVAANPPPPSSCGAGKGGGVGAAGMAGAVGGLDHQRRSMYDSSGWMFVPLPPPPTATSALIDPRVGSGAAAAARTVPFARATVLGNMPVCEVVPMTTTPSPALAQPQAQYEEEVVRDGGANSGTNDALPVWSIKCGKFVKIGLMSFGLVAASVIITVVVMMVGFNEDDTVPVVDINDNGTSGAAIVTGTASTDAMGTAVGTVLTSASTGTGSTATTSNSTSTMTTPVITTVVSVKNSRIALSCSLNLYGRGYRRLAPSSFF